MTEEPFDFAQCLAQVRGNDPNAARALVERLHPLVIRIVRSHLPVRAAEEDLAQKVFGRLFAKLDQYQHRPGIPFDHWVARLTVHTCLDVLRSERRRPELRWADLPEDQAAALEYLLVDEQESPESSPESAREVVERLLAGLPPPDRLVIRLLDLEQKTVKEIASLTGWNIPLIKVRAFRARRKLRKLAQQLREEMPHEEL
ncbi:MAG: sigma-70 family RNA polymerase sigma factor [Verrucomicrobia bacterium]|nr:sigma-70 family RNA polymerase sigma factor [Verrucomicrobiota bacterium]